MPNYNQNEVLSRYAALLKESDMGFGAALKEMVNNPMDLFSTIKGLYQVSTQQEIDYLISKMKDLESSIPEGYSGISAAFGPGGKWATELERYKTELLKEVPISDPSTAPTTDPTALYNVASSRLNTLNRYIKFLNSIQQMWPQIKSKLSSKLETEGAINKFEYALSVALERANNGLAQASSGVQQYKGQGAGLKPICNDIVNTYAQIEQINGSPVEFETLEERQVYEWSGKIASGDVQDLMGIDQYHQYLEL